MQATFAHKTMASSDDEEIPNEKVNLFTDTAVPPQKEGVVNIKLCLHPLKMFDFNTNTWKLGAKPVDEIFVELPLSHVKGASTDAPHVKSKHILKALVQRQRLEALFAQAKDPIATSKSTSKSAISVATPMILNIDLTKGISLKTIRSPSNPGVGHILLNNGDEIVVLFRPDKSKPSTIVPNPLIAHLGILTYMQKLPVNDIFDRVLFFSEKGLGHTDETDPSKLCTGKQLSESISHSDDKHLAHLMKMHFSTVCSFGNRFQQ